MHVNGVNWFPYVSPSWLQRLVELLRRTIPQRIDAEWCLEANRFSFTANNASQFISQIRALGWISEDGAVTERGRGLRQDGAPYQQFMREEIERVYDELHSQISDTSLDRDAIEMYFTAASSLGLSGRRQVISAFRWFLGQAGYAEAAERLGGVAVGGAPRGRQLNAPRPRRQRAGTQQAIQPEAPVTPLTLAPAGIPITLNISLQLPAVENEEVYRTIFKAMREYLLSGTEE